MLWELQGENLKLSLLGSDELMMILVAAMSWLPQFEERGIQLPHSKVKIYRTCDGNCQQTYVINQYCGQDK